MIFDRTLNPRALRGRRHADGAAAALCAVHDRQSLVSLLLVPKPNEAKALRRAGHGVGYDLGAQHRGVLVKERRLQLGVGHFRREVANKQRVLWGLFYTLAARAPVQSVT